MIVAENIKKEITQHEILKNMSFKIEDHEIVALVGNNGAGKTTLMKVISGILDINEGSMSGDGNVGKDYLKWAYQNVAYQSTNERGLSYKNTVIDNIIYYGILKGTPKKDILINLDYYLKFFNFSSQLERRVEELSTGQKKIVKLLSAFCCQCKYLILDEPSDGLDVENIDIVKKILLDMMTKGNKVIVLSSHDLNFLIDVSTKFLIFKDGILIEKTKSNVNEEDLRNMFSQGGSHE